MVAAHSGYPQPATAMGSELFDEPVCKEDIDNEILFCVEYYTTCNISSVRLLL